MSTWLYRYRIVLGMAPGFIGTTSGTFGWPPLVAGAALAVVLVYAFRRYIWSPIENSKLAVVSLAREFAFYDRMRWVFLAAIIAGALVVWVLPGKTVVDALRAAGSSTLTASYIFARYLWLRHRWRTVMGQRTDVEP